jgi:novel protein kinase C delta type
MAGDVMDQPFFRNMDWNRLERRELEPPFKPKVVCKLTISIGYLSLIKFTREED